jgi:phosphopantothenoylcysteine synthetase/decarboxylase
MIDAARADGWEVALAATRTAESWVGDTVDLSDVGFRNPDQPKRPRPDAVVVLPLTFNTASKWALGLADNRPLSLLCETLGARKPIIAVPMVNESLWMHPAWRSHLDALIGAGVVLLDPATGQTPTRPLQTDSVDDLVAAFDPAWVLDRLR